jgi:HlyD family secretion protein
MGPPDNRKTGVLCFDGVGVRHGLLLFFFAGALLLSTALPAQLDEDMPNRVSALGRLEPQYGILTISASSAPEAIFGAVVVELHVKVGDDVEAGQLLAVTDTARVLQMRANEARTGLALAEKEAKAATSLAEAACVRAGVLEREAERLTRLSTQNLASEEETDRARGAADASAADCTAARSAIQVAESGIKVAAARLQTQLAELDRAYVRALLPGRVLAINTYPGEQIRLDGIIEMGRVDRMYAIAEVYETDVGRLRIGQRATVSSPALPAALTGAVESIRPLVRKQDEIGTDPAARKDARIVEVDVLLDKSDTAAGLTNLQVDVVFEP